MNHEAKAGAPVYLRPVHLGLVFLGGTLGVLARAALTLVVPDLGGLPIAVFIANILGAFLLGLLLEVLTRDDGEVTAQRSIRLLLGTGVLGGFTTYSALAQAVVLLWADGSVLLALGYGVATLLIGGIATWLGMLLGTSISRSRSVVNVDE